MVMDGANEQLQIVTDIQDGNYPNGKIKWKANGYLNIHMKIPTGREDSSKEEKRINTELNKVCIKRLVIPRDFKLKDILPFGTIEVNKEHTFTHITHTHNVKYNGRCNFKVYGDNSIYRTGPD